MAKDAKDKAFDRVAKLAKALKLAEVTVGTSYGNPSLKVRDKSFVTVKEAEVLVLPCPLEVKELLMESAPQIYYQTPHYHGWAYLLVRLDVIGDEELSLRIEDAWRHRAPKRLGAARPSGT